MPRHPAGRGSRACRPRRASRCRTWAGTSSSRARRSPLLDGIDAGAYVYFVHSYAAPVGPRHARGHRLRRRLLGGRAARDNFHGAQFHPERSAARGRAPPRQFPGTRPDMQLVPAIDLRGGHCVRLLQGRFDAETVYGNDPRGTARALPRRWAPATLHVVDLDGARDGSQGNRDGDRAAARASRAITHPGRRRRPHARRGGRSCSARRATRRRRQRGGDATRRRSRSGCASSAPTASCWRSTSASTQAARRASRRTAGSSRPRRQPVGRRRALPAARRCCTCCARTSPATARSSGPNLALYAEAVRRFPQIQWQASGGVSCGCRPACARTPRASPRRSAARPCSRIASRPRSSRHSCQAHNSLPRRARRPGRQGRALPRSPGRGRHPRARRALSRRRRGRARLLRHHGEPRGPLRRSQLDHARRARARHPVLRGRRHPHASPTPRTCSMPAPRRSR